MKNKKIEKYCLIILLVVLGIGCFVNRNSELEASLVSHPDSKIVFNTDHQVMEQTWQPNIKKITGIKIPYTAENSFTAKMELKIFSDDYRELLVQTDISSQFAKGTSGMLEFSFDSVKVILGERYHIQLSYLDSDAYGEIYIPSGSNYEGCTVADKEKNEAAAFTICFVKVSRIFWIIAVFFPMGAFSLLLMAGFKRKWEETIGAAFIIEILMLYVFGLFNQLENGVVAVYVVGMCSLIAAVGILLKKRIQVKELLSLGILVYGIIFGLVCVNCKGAFFAMWDEYIHWGLAAKDMFYYDSFARHVDTTVRLIRYMPFSTLTEYLFVYINGLFSQEIVYVALQSLILSLIIVLFGKKLCTKWYSILAAISVGILLPTCFFSDVYNSIYVDALLAFLIFYVLFCYSSEGINLFNYIRIACGLLALTLTKDMGFVIAGILVMIMAGDTLIRQLYRKQFSLKKYWVEFSLGIEICLAFLSWQIYLSLPLGEAGSNTAPESAGGAISASGLSIGGIIELLKGNAPGYRYSSIKNFLIEIFDGDTFKFGSVSVSYINLLVIIVLLTIALTTKKYWGNKSKEILLIYGLAAFGGIIYGCVLELLYLFAFPENEAVSLASHGRYLGTFACGILMAFLGMLLVKEKKNQADKVMAICVSCVILIITPISAFVIKNMDHEVTAEYVYYSDELTEVLRSFSRRGEKIYYVCNNADGIGSDMFQNFVLPLNVEKDLGCDFLASEQSVEEQRKIASEKMEEIINDPGIVSVKEWESQLEKCDYVFFLHAYDLFGKDYGESFEDPNSIGDGALYKVVQDKEGSVKLKSIGKIGVNWWRK